MKNTVVKQGTHGAQRMNSATKVPAVVHQRISCTADTEGIDESADEDH
jgi:hypothetical protein